jgi:CRP/FNR family transcriptional regulator
LVRAPRRAPTAYPAPRRELAANEFLFRDGDARGDVYRVERGAVCHYIVWDDGHHEIIEFAFPGDLIGFGHRGNYISTAQAMVETEVSAVSADEFRDVIEADAQLAARVAAADDREFEYARTHSVNANTDKPVERVASLIAALSHLNEPEGRDPTLITDEIASDAVADRLNMSRDGVEHVLTQLEGLGLIRSSAAGLRIVDMDGLEKLADAA